MKLSIITTIYRRPEEIDSFFERIYTQKNKNFELVVVIDTNVLQQFEKLEKWAKKFKGKLKIAYNTKRQGRTKSYIDGIKMATGDYTLFISTSDELKRYDGVDEILKAIKKTGNPDVLEFPATFRGVTRWNSELRIKASSATTLEKKPTYIAKTTPFTLNKVFKTKLMLEAASIHSGIELNTRFATEWMYLFLVKYASTFATVNKRLVKTFISKTSISFNPMRIATQSTKLMQRVDSLETSYLQEITYASLYNIAIFLPIFTIAYRNKVMFDKLFIQIGKLFDNEFKTSLITNKYLLKNNREAIWLSAKRTKTEIKKLVKEFR